MIVRVTVAVVKGDGCNRFVKGFATFQSSPQFVQRKKAVASSKPIQVAFQCPAADQHRWHIVVCAGGIILYHSVVAKYQGYISCAGDGANQPFGSGPMQCAGYACFSESPQHTVR